MTTYWEKRIEKLNNETYKDADKYVRELRKLYEQEINNIEEKIYNHLSKLQEEAGGISLFDAKKLLNDKELDLFKIDLEGFMKKSQGKISPELERELNIISRRVRISRLQAMEVEMKKTVAGLMTREEKGLFAHLGRTYERRYYKELYELQRITGYDSVRKISKEDLDMILKDPWTSDGREFSQRIWDRGDKLANALKDNLTRNIARGASPEESIKEIQKQFGVSKAAASRLVYTETAAISSKATQDSYKRIGVKKYEILATLDLRTSDICRSQDGKTYDIKDYRVGITAPPFHPNCRTDTIPFFDDDLERQLDKNVRRSARNPKTKKTEIVENINYENWYKNYVIGDKVGKSGYIINTENNDEIKLDKLKAIFKEDDFKEYLKIISENPNEGIRKLYRNYGDKPSSVRLSDKAFYDKYENSVNVQLNDRYEVATGISKFSTIAHEYGHFFDYNIKLDLDYSELDKLSEVIPTSLLPSENTLSASSEFIEAIRKDRKHLKEIGFESLKKSMFTDNASMGVQDAIDGMFEGDKNRINWGHGEIYYNRKYNKIAKYAKIFGEDFETNLIRAYNELGYKIKTKKDLKSLIRDYETASEAWANIMSAETNQGKELEYVKKYLPNSYEALIKIIEEVE